MIRVATCDCIDKGVPLMQQRYMLVFNVFFFFFVSLFCNFINRSRHANNIPSSLINIMLDNGGTREH